MFLNHDHDHSPEAIAERLNAGPQVYYLKEWVYGGIDGVVTTFAIVAAVIGADLSYFIVLIMGLASVVGDGFSMAAGSYSATKAERDNYKRLHAIESSHIKKHPEGEIEETRQIFASKGFKGEEINQMTDMISRDHDLWIEFMLSEEYGVSKPSHTPIKSALHTFLSFLVCGFMPLIPYLLSLPYSAHIALALSAITFFIIGSGKSIWSVKKWWHEGIETTLIGLSAAALAYGIGYGLKIFFNI